jgi:eukaryotic-like serine/threonine-protein kinase
VLVARDGTVKITDFGISWSASSVPLTQTGQVVGTAHYLSPEQAAGGKAGPASDVYALGLVAYECLTGRRAFEAATAVEVALMHANTAPDPLPAGVPGSVRTLVSRMLAKDPDERFPDGAALLSAVEEVLAGPGVLPETDRTAASVPPFADLELEPVSHRAARWSRAPRQPRHAAPSRRRSRRLLVLLLAVLTAIAVVTAVLAGTDRAPAFGAPQGRGGDAATADPDAGTTAVPHP